jgi:hypothetical protein
MMLLDELTLLLLELLGIALLLLDAMPELLCVSLLLGVSLEDELTSLSLLELLNISLLLCATLLELLDELIFPDNSRSRSRS